MSCIASYMNNKEYNFNISTVLKGYVFASLFDNGHRKANWITIDVESCSVMMLLECGNSVCHLIVANI